MPFTTWLPRIRSWFTGLLLRRRVEQDMADELEFHIAARTDDLVRLGISRKEALRKARLEFGAAGRYQEECRESRGLRLLDEARSDLRYALRGLRRNPGFTAVVVLSLALGIGANTAMFSVVNGVLLRPLPYRDPGRLVAIEETMPESLYSMKAFRVPPVVNALLRRDQLQSFEDLVAMDHSSFQLVDTDDPVELQAGLITSNFCFVLGVTPVIGRCFTAEEQSKQSSVVMLGYEVWQQGFQGDPAIAGREIVLKSYSDKRNFTVAGVLPPQFRLGTERPELWMPISESSNFRRRNESWKPGILIGRLKPGIAASQARAELAGLQRRLFPTQYEGNGGHRIRVLPYLESLSESVKPGLAILLGVVGLVLLITCVNVANLLLSRGSTRMREIAVRKSLGASRVRIVRQLLTEALTLAFIGGILGAVIAQWMLEGMKLLTFSSRLPRVDEIQIDWTVMAFAALISFLSGTLFGLLPALRLTRGDLAGAMKSGGAAVIGGSRQQRLMSSLVVFEVALCAVAMTGAGLLINTFIRLKGVDPGFRTDRVLVASVNSGAQNSIHLLARILERVESMPGVEAAAFTNNPPPHHIRNIQEFRRSGTADVFGAGGPRANSRTVSAQYFRTMGIPILRGRAFDATDQPNSRAVVVISEALARRYWPAGDALGHTIVLSKYRQEVTAEIVGIVGNVRQTGLREDADDLIYTAYTQGAGPSLNLVVRTRGEPAALVPSLKQEVRTVDREQPFRAIFTMEELMAREVAEPRFYMVLLGAYGVLALALTTLGIGGLVAYSVSRRTREIGLRISFGATRSSLLRMFATGSLRLIGAGLLIGIPGSYAVTRFTRSLLYEITPADPPTLALVALLLIVMSLTVCLATALRATFIQPSIVLRHE